MVRKAQRVLWAVGFAILGYCGMAWMNARLEQMRGYQQLNRLLNREYAERPEYGGLVGKMEIPRLHLSAVVFEGTDDPILGVGVGHLQGSALPGQPGNVVLAGHRDSFFRALREIRDGDDVEITSQYGTRTYRVSSTEIINPDQVSVLEPTAHPTLTLVTCYPFYYIGNAPNRFIVRGLEVSSGSNSDSLAPKAPLLEASASQPASEQLRGGKSDERNVLQPDASNEHPGHGINFTAKRKAASAAAGRQTASVERRYHPSRPRLRVWNDFH